MSNKPNEVMLKQIALFIGPWNTWNYERKENSLDLIDLIFRLLIYLYLFIVITHYFKGVLCRFATGASRSFASKISKCGSTICS